MNDALLRWFEFAHLPPSLQLVSRQFSVLALSICQSLPPCAERTVALRTLLESKDAAVRAAIQGSEPSVGPGHILPKEA